MTHTGLVIIGLAAFTLPALAQQQSERVFDNASVTRQIEIPEGAYEIALPNLIIVEAPIDQTIGIQRTLVERLIKNATDATLTPGRPGGSASLRYKLPDRTTRRFVNASGNLDVVHDDASTTSTTYEHAQHVEVTPSQDADNVPTPNNPSAVEMRAAASAGYVLANAAPNVVSSHTAISFTLPRAGRTQLAVFDNGGQVVATLVDEVLEAGTHSRMFDASTLPAGTYLYRLSSGGFAEAKTITVVR